VVVDGGITAGRTQSEMAANFALFEKELHCVHHQNNLPEMKRDCAIGEAYASRETLGTLPDFMGSRQARTGERMSGTPACRSQKCSPLITVDWKSSRPVCIATWPYRNTAKWTLLHSTFNFILLLLTGRERRE
jgi:hypothetical protein